MSILEQLGRLVEDPPPPYVFEISPAGIAWAILGKPIRSGFQPLDEDVLSISPVRDNVLRADALEQSVAAISPMNGTRKRRDAALILPDYSTRVAVLEFDSFPTDKKEQLALVRFRMKRAVPFDLDSAAISFHAQTADKKHEVVTVAAPIEIVARYEAPLRRAGYAPGLITTSMLSAMDLLAREGLVMAAKLTGRILTVTLSEGTRLRLLRCVEMESRTLEEIMALLAPTLVYAEDELPSRPDRLVACGFGELSALLKVACRQELGLEVEPLRSPWGAPTENNAGLLGYLQASGEMK
jgi:type IV pilus assembly protein PilM